MISTADEISQSEGGATVTLGSVMAQSRAGLTGTVARVIVQEAVGGSHFLDGFRSRGRDGQMIVRGGRHDELPF